MLIFFISSFEICPDFSATTKESCFSLQGNLIFKFSKVLFQMTSCKGQDHSKLLFLYNIKNLPLDSDLNPGLSWATIHLFPKILLSSLGPSQCF